MNLANLSQHFNTGSAEKRPSFASSISSLASSRRSSSSSRETSAMAQHTPSAVGDDDPNLLSTRGFGSKRGSTSSRRTSSSSFFTTPFSSTSPLFHSAVSAVSDAAEDLGNGAYTRRISVPLKEAKESKAGRRLSSFVDVTRRRVRRVSGAVGNELGEFMMLGEKPSSQPFGPDINREWEIVTVRELCRRLSLDDTFEPSEMPLPEGALSSRILDEFMIRQVVDILPPRAEGYPWVLVYSSEKNGFSLATLYRKMAEWTEEMSPILLVIRDTQGHVFGAVASTALRPSEHGYYGTGDSSLLFRFTGEYPHTRELRSYTWTGENQFFINATKESLSMGAGGGHYGIWLDADLNHGRSQKCTTFDNEPLAGGLEEDFVVQYVEAFGFSM